MNSIINFKLNGEQVSWEGDSAARLLEVLRDDFKNTGVKCGCKEGECGACSIILDGKLVNSCMAAMGSVESSDITTIEGYKNTPQFAVLNKAYADISAVQCGFCIPGMILASECILQENPNPTENDIRVGISGNLCRCTGYNAIVTAITNAAKEGKGLW